MRVFWLAGLFGLVKGWKQEFNYEQKCGLVYVKLRCVKDRALDAVAVGERDLRVTCFLFSVISCTPYTELHQEELSIVKQNWMDLLNCLIRLNPPPRQLLKEWQMLPYTSLHSDVSHLDLDPDVCKKRIGVFHELLHFTA
ncbi:hypothetical protein CFP56_024536 [Quercus suber]|uniref:PORR domain-containing protein n=1 Tax=Quercus suber TaxID=58331 RepID=A0AAW0M0H9_QUESU